MEAYKRQNSINNDKKRKFRNNHNTKIPVAIYRLNGQFFILTFSSIFAYTFVFFLQPQPYYEELEELRIEAFRTCRENARYAEVYRKKEKLPKHIKYILLWTRNDFEPFLSFGEGQRAFIRNNCPVIDCYITADRKFFGNDLMRFNAIAFNGRNLKPSDLPLVRYDHQKYIYVNMESAENKPVCNRVFDNFFNWTSTYRLDSDLMYLYLQIRNKEGKVMGPKRHMTWNKSGVVDDEIKLRIKTKNKAAAWMVSNCESFNKRETLAKKISRQLNSANLSLDIYGKCGTMKCPRLSAEYCWRTIEQKYYFYLSFENSNSIDYVTEKLLNPLQHLTIPIVFGGADYSRFLPPGSYLDASKLSVENLVAKMYAIISSKDLYMEFFKWRSLYTYTNAEKDSVCAICSALHNEKMMKVKKTHKWLRKWWSPAYKNICPELKRKYKILFSVLNLESFC